MTKPDWVGEVTPDITAILAGRDWERLNDDEWQRIEDIVSRRPVAVDMVLPVAKGEPPTTTVDGTRHHVHAWQRRRLWDAKANLAADAASGIADWSGRDDPPERPLIEYGRPSDQGVTRGRWSLREDREIVAADGTIVEIVRPRRTPTGRGVGKRGLGRVPPVDLLDDDNARGRLEQFWRDHDADTDRRLTKTDVQRSLGYTRWELARAFTPDGWRTYSSSGVLRPKRSE